MIKNLLEEVEFNCDNEGCEEVIRYSKVKEHELECTKRRATCTACGASMPFLNLEIHQVHPESARKNENPYRSQNIFKFLFKTLVYLKT